MLQVQNHTVDYNQRCVYMNIQPTVSYDAIVVL